MNKRLLNNLLYGALLLSVGTSVFSCKDYDDDIAGLDNRISTVGKIQRENSSGFRCQFNSSFLVS